MSRDADQWRRRFAGILRQTLLDGGHVEVEGLGRFEPGKNEGFQFFSETKARVFIAYVEEDQAPASRLYDALAAHGFQPWMDKRKLLPGQNWPRAIEAAIQTSDFFIACFSKRAVCKRGSFHSELRFALECAAQVPLDEIFLIPVRLENCVLPARISGQTQYVDLFPNWGAGIRRIRRVMREQERLRDRKQLPLAG